MDRRRYLIAAGAMLGLAGCTSSPSTDTPTSTDSPTATKTRTDTATGSPTATKTDKPTETATETATPEPGAEAQPYVEEAEESVVDAVQVVLNYGPPMNAQFSSSVTASTTDFDDSELATAVRTAEDAISEAESYETSSDQDETLSELSDFLGWLRLYRETMAGVIDCYKHVRNALGRYLNEYDVEAAQSNIDQLHPDLRLTKADYQSLESSFSNLGSEATSDISNITSGQVQSTMDRLGKELSATEVFHSELPRIMSGEEAYQSGADDYRSESYSEAESHFTTSRDKLNNAQSAISDAAKPSAYSGEFGKLSCLTKHLSDAAEAGRKAAVYADVNDSERRQESVEENEEAIEALGECDLDMSKRPDYY